LAEWRTSWFDDCVSCRRGFGGFAKGENPGSGAAAGEWDKGKVKFAFSCRSHVFLGQGGDGREGYDPGEDLGSLVSNGIKKIARYQAFVRLWPVLAIFGRILLRGWILTSLLLCAMICWKIEKQEIRRLILTPSEGRLHRPIGSSEWLRYLSTLSDWLLDTRKLHVLVYFLYNLTCPMKKDTRCSIVLLVT
jgi:hypothetical protein